MTMWPRVDRAGGRATWIAPALWSIFLPLRQRELAHAPFHQVVAGDAHQRAGDVADDAERHHADHDGRVAHHDVGGPDDVAEAVLPGNHRGGYQREPRH